MKPFLAILAFILCLIHSSFSQSSFKSGYIIKGLNDTIRGLIKYEQWTKNPRLIVFMSAPGKTEELSPQSIKGFYVQKRSFVSGNVTVDDRSDELADLTDNGSFETSNDVVFLETIIEGNKSLYLYNDSKGLEHYYISNNDQYELLLYKKYLQANGQVNRVVERNQFHRQLSSYLGDCKSLSGKIETVKYSYSSLVDLFNEYRVCSNVSKPIQKTRLKTHFEGGVLAGLTNTRLSMTSEGYLVALSKTSFTPSNNFAAGAYMNLRFPGALSLDNEIIYTSFKTSGTAEDYKSENEYSTLHSRIGASYLKLNNILTLNINAGNAVLSVGAGVSNGMMVSMTNEKTYTFKYYNNEQTDEGKLLEQPRKLETGFICDLGAKISKYSLQLKYEKANGFSNVISVGARTTRIYVLAGYQLF